MKHIDVLGLTFSWPPPAESRNKTIPKATHLQPKGAQGTILIILNDLEHVPLNQNLPLFQK